MNAELIAKYFEYQRTRDAKLHWAWEEVQARVDRDGLAAWPLVLELIRAAPDDAVLNYVAAGPLEELLCDHGDAELLASIEVSLDARVKQALRGVWGRGRMRREVWSELERLRR